MLWKKYQGVVERSVPVVERSIRVVWKYKGVVERSIRVLWKEVSGCCGKKYQGVVERSVPVRQPTLSVCQCVGQKWMAMRLTHSDSVAVITTLTKICDVRCWAMWQCQGTDSGTILLLHADACLNNAQPPLIHGHNQAHMCNLAALTNVS